MSRVIGLTMNKGEWSEAYALLAILSKPAVNLCDKNLCTTQTTRYRVTRAYLSSDGGHHDIELKILTSHVGVNFSGQMTVVQVSEVKDIAQKLLRKIQSSSKTFSFEELDLLWDKFHNPKIKGSSGSKVDIYLEIEDLSNNSLVSDGFSVKSNLGSPTSLLNASTLTNFLYSTSAVSSVAPGLKPKKMVSQAIRGVIAQYGPCDATYKANLKMISSNFDGLISSLLLEYFSARGGKVSKVTNSLLLKTPFLSPQVCSAELLSFLKATAFGMVPSVVWNGSYSVTGGMIVVKESGEIAFFYLKDLSSTQELDDYLFENCKFDTADPRRHGFGSIINGNQFKLNLLIRL